MRKIHKTHKIEDKPILRVFSALLIPFVALYAIYVQLNGEYSPGGGFQAGVILAAPIILFSLFLGADIMISVIPMSFLRSMAAAGVLAYSSTGLAGIFCGRNFLDYSAFAENFGQKLGIFLVELGVGMTVFSAMLIIYFSFAARRKND